MHGERGRIALRNPQAFSCLFFPFDDMTCPFNLTALQGAFETLRIDELKVYQRAGIVIQRDNHIPGAERHAAGFMHSRERQTFQRWETLAGEVGVAGGRSGFIHKPDGQRGRAAAALRSASVSASAAAITSGATGGRLPVTAFTFPAASEADTPNTFSTSFSPSPAPHWLQNHVPRPSLSSKRKRSEPPHTGQD
ncbi:Uncharacterised protein [Salmonella enterica subsp. enterica serovar Bovismorbificans]|nr:Uncharacterised protein [Salmonella enterica subsp. enterica serovar Bovismorbificans]